MKAPIGRDRMYSDDFPGRDDVILWDVIEIQPEQGLRLTFVSTRSQHKQGVRLAIDVGEGYIEIDKDQSRGIRVWEHAAPKSILCRCVTSAGLLSVYNVWEMDGDDMSQGYGSGMLVEQDGNTRTYHCNDYGLDTEFDKLVFTIELI